VSRLLCRRHPRPHPWRPARCAGDVPRADPHPYARAAPLSAARSEAVHRAQCRGGAIDQPGGALRRDQRQYRSARCRRGARLSAPHRGLDRPPHDRSGPHRGRRHRRSPARLIFPMAPHPQRLSVIRRTWPLARSFAISRGSKTTAEVVVAEIFDGEFRARGECVPYPRYGESVDSVVRALEDMRGAVFSGLDRKELQQAMPPGAARNALDAAFWDLDAKRYDRRAADLAGIGTLRPLVTAYT